MRRRVSRSFHSSGFDKNRQQEQRRMVAARLKNRLCNPSPTVYSLGNTRLQSPERRVASELSRSAMREAISNYANPFPPLELSAEDESQLESLAHLFVQNTIVECQRYLLQDNRIVDEDRWKFVKRREDIRVYAERREKEIAKRRSKSRHNLDDAESTASSSASSSAATKNQRFDAKLPRNLDLPVLFVVGTLEGALDDAMYGAVNPTVEMLRTKTSYVNDNVVGAAVLATLIAPTPEDPFRTMTIKWFEKGQPLHIRTIVHNRDMVFLESTGITQLANGERIGYQLLHSVHFPQTQPLDTAIRGNMSICALYRQYNATSVDVYIKGYMNPAGGLMRAVVIKSAADGMVSAWKYVHCARMKKLAWVLRQRHGCPIEQIHDDESRDSITTSSRVTCVNCKKKPSTHFLSSRKRATCKLCLKYVCSSCKMKKQLSYITLDGKLQQTELTLCTLCVHDAMVRTNATVVASEETAARRKQSTFRDESSESPGAAAYPMDSFHDSQASPW